MQGALLALLFAFAATGAWGADAAVSLEVPAVPPPLLSPLSLKPGKFTFAFPSQTGQTYEVQFKDALDDPEWTPILTNSGTGDWITNEIPASNSAGFFRMMVR